jgi:predicted MFS family arabinose efflux permease
LAVLLLYKSGHALATAMLRPWLVDHGYSMTDIAWVLGSGGFVAGFVGAMAGGYLAARFDRARLLIALGFLQCVAVASYMWPGLTSPAVYKVLITASFDHFTSGLATVTLFTLMMDASSRARAATDYTLQACVVVVAQTATSALSGWSAEHFGYGLHFALSAGLAVSAACLTALILTRTRARNLVAIQR